MGSKVLLVGKAFKKLFPEVESVFDGLEVDVCSEEELLNYLPSAEVMVIGPMKVEEALLNKAPNLKFIHQWGVGVEKIDLTACAERGVKVCNVPAKGTGNAEGVGELAIMHMLLLARRWNRTQENLRKKRLYAPRGVALWKKTVTVIGLGNVGQCVIQRVKGFGMNVIGVNRSFRPEFDSLMLDEFCLLKDLHRVLPRSNFIVLALELNKETMNIVDESFFDAVSEGTYLINVARAELVKRSALEKALEGGKLAGIGLDVFWDEPADPEDPLLADPRVLVTPHIGGVTDEAVKGVANFIADNIRRFYGGEELKSLLTRGNEN